MLSLVYIAVAILSFRAVYLTGNPLSCDKSQLNGHCTFIPSEQGGFQLTPKYVIDDPLILLQASQDNVTIQLYCSYPACLSNPCHNGGVCQETLEGFNCSCVGPFYGETCTDYVFIGIQHRCPHAVFQGSLFDRKPVILRQIPAI
ncbi:uncharacterized protein [Diadema setosum]|uniref:uncharacterized protein isoform X3 n=1 Tax=Diadema setosum TaxID=31175 RepID=UPI003B3A5B14